MRYALALTFAQLFALAAPLHAETLSQEIARTGIAATEARLAALPAPTDEEAFTLGGLHFLRAVEISFQDRWRQGLTDRTGMIPFLRLPLADNPAPEPFTPATIAGIFAKAQGELAQARAILTAIPETSDFTAEITLEDLWFDVDANGTRGADEGLTQILAATLGSDAEAAGQPGSMTIRFDVADAAWLAAYADVLSSLCHVVLAYDPTEPITRVLSAKAAMSALGPTAPDYFFGTDGPVDPVDAIAILLAALNQQPDKTHMAAAQTDLLDMVAQNRAFWARVARETDDAAEWLPGKGQHAALGIEVPPDAAQNWGAVLDQVEAILQGKLLIPYWRMGDGVGVNMAKVFADPRPVDLAGWIQGWAALPYLEKGQLAAPDALDAFDQAVQGDAMLFAIWFN